MALFCFFMEKEIWKDVVGYEGLYKVSNLGEVISCPKIRRRIGTNKKLVDFFYKEKRRKKVLFSSGYFIVAITKNRIIKQASVHRLVAEAFIENPNFYRNVNHIDGNKQNNRVENLEWVSNLQNCRHASSTGLCPRGSKHKNSKLTESQVLEIREELKNNCYLGINIDLAKKYNVSPDCISRVKNNNNWKNLEMEVSKVKLNFLCSCGKEIEKEVTDRINNSVVCDNCKKNYDVFLRIYGYGGEHKCQTKK